MERECKRHDEKWRNMIMGQIEMKKKAITFIKKFLDDYKLNSLDDLKSFSFWEIEKDKNYNGYQGEYDGDRTNIVYAIDYLLYNTKIPNLTLRGYPCINDEEASYSGDTINTFRTLFGNRFTGTEQKFEKEFLNNDENKIKIKNDFFRTYQKIGNFYILPNGKYKNTKKSINTYRGTAPKYIDFFDEFLNNLYTDNDEILLSLKNEEINKNFFDAFPNLKSFCELFYLDDYENLDFHHPETKNGLKCNLRYFKSLGIDKSKYLNFAFAYIEKATDLINKRSVKIVEELKFKYPELTQ
jgi:hypothetical protein